MKRPGIRTQLLGSRWTAPFVILGSAWYVCRWWRAGGPDNTGLLAIALLIFSAKSASTILAYRKWRADWEAMGPGGGKPSRVWLRPKPVLGVLAALLILGLIASASGPNATPQANERLGFAGMGSVALGVLLITIRLARRIRWPRRRPDMPVVVIAIRHPVLRVPSLDECYKRLPGYCQQLLKASRS